jgi:hypothetical protein
MSITMFWIDAPSVSNDGPKISQKITSGRKSATDNPKRTIRSRRLTLIPTSGSRLMSSSPLLSSIFEGFRRVKVACRPNQVDLFWLTIQNTTRLQSISIYCSSQIEHEETTRARDIKVYCCEDLQPIHYASKLDLSLNVELFFRCDSVNGMSTERTTLVPISKSAVGVCASHARRRRRKSAPNEKKARNTATMGDQDWTTVSFKKRKPASTGNKQRDVNQAKQRGEQVDSVKKRKFTLCLRSAHLQRQRGNQQKPRGTNQREETR